MIPINEKVENDIMSSTQELLYLQNYNIKQIIWQLWWKGMIWI